jgi:hypothetical protein
MARLTKADAARQLGIARSTLYKLIDQGKVSPTPDGLIDEAELVRVAAYVDAISGRSRTSEDTPVSSAPLHIETPHGRLPDTVRVQTGTDTYGRPQTSEDVLMSVLREQVQDLREQLQEARQNAQAARDREALLLQMLHDMQHRYDRLLEAPRATPPAQEASRATRERGDPHAMRKRILEVLQGHPEGLHHADIAQALGETRDFGPTLRGMLRDRLVRRVGAGAYAVVEGQ